MEYLCETVKFLETVFACLYGAQVKSFKQKKGRKSGCELSPRPTRLDVVSDLMLYKTRSFHLTGCELGTIPTRLEVFILQGVNWALDLHY